MISYRVEAGLVTRLYRKIWHSRRLKSKHLSATSIRQHFIDYFMSSGHSYIRSSPVRPFSDPTLEFVNAGMNQFKNVFLGLRTPPALSATNSQKCIRIGGKHNDLDVVGHDTYHHTFFEMLGNWSFGNYFKKEACQLAWKLMTSPPFSLPADRLYVTYFGGDSNLSLGPDLETREIWLSIGVDPKRIVPFGLQDNFWEMGLTGPCGPCTEIHYDHLGSTPRPQFINKDLVDLTELWNLVFIQYKREENGTLTPLPQSFVDTGMGFERLVAILQEKFSNYDTDLFSPLFDTIHKNCKVPPYMGKFGADDRNSLDTSYRTLADHARMVTVALADSIFPYQSHGLRRVLRKALRIADTLQSKNGVDLVVNLSKVIVHSLENAYPEMIKNSKQIEYVIRDEYNLWKQVLSSTMKEWQAMVTADPKLDKLTDVLGPGLIGALKEVENLNDSSDLLPLDLALILYDRYGLNVQLIEELSSIKGYSLNIAELQSRIDDLKMSYKKALTGAAQATYQSPSLGSLLNCPPTNCSPRYEYNKLHNGDYEIPDVMSHVLTLISNSDALKEGEVLENGNVVGVVLDQTNCWSSEKGATDIGSIALYEGDNQVGSVEFDNVLRIGDHIVHTGIFSSLMGKKVKVGKWKAKVTVNLLNRMRLMRNVTSSHLVAQALKNKFVGHLSYFSNNANGFTMKFIIYDPDASEAGLILLEHEVNRLVKLNLPSNLTIVSLSELLGNDDISIPYIINRQVDHFPLVQIPFENSHQCLREVSYGPNLLETGSVQEFCFTDVIFNRKQREVTLKCLTGPSVEAAYIVSENLLEELRSLNEDSPVTGLNAATAKAKTLISENMVPICFRVELNHLVIGLEKSSKARVKDASIKSMAEVVTSARNLGSPFLVHYAGEDCKLEKLTKACQDLPVMVFAYNRGHLTARCCTPPSSRVEANIWMTKVAQVLDSEPSYYKGHDKKLLCGLKPVKITKNRLAEVNSQLQDIVGKAFENS